MIRKSPAKTVTPTVADLSARVGALEAARRIDREDRERRNQNRFIGVMAILFGIALVGIGVTVGKGIGREEGFEQGYSEGRASVLETE